MNNQKSPIKQQRMKNLHSMSVSNSNHTRSNSSMGSSHLKTMHSQSRHYSQTISPTAMSAGALPAVPLFYCDTYADPPECSLLPKPPESWYLKSNDEKHPAQIDEKKKKSKQKYLRKSDHRNDNKGFYTSFYSTRSHGKLPTPYISVKG